MRIVIVSSGTKNRDGWSTYTRILSDTLSAEGHSVVHHIENNPISFLTNPFVAPLKSWKLRSTIRKQQPDIIHVTVEPLAMMLAFLPAKWLKQCALTVHGSYGVRLFQDKNAKRSHNVLRNIGTIITVSNYTKKCLLEVAGDLPSVHVVHNAIELPDRIDHIQSDTKQIICVGGIKPRKGITEALESLTEYIKTKDTNVHFTIIGSFKKDDYYQQVQNLIYAHSLNKHVTITGSVSDDELADYFRKANLLLMPAKTTTDTFEGFGLVYIEANAYGVPCIGPNDSGAAEAIKDGFSGLQADPENPTLIAEAMYAILEESTIRPEDCIEWAKKFNPKNMGKAMLSVYEMLQSA